MFSKEREVLQSSFSANRNQNKIAVVYYLELFIRLEN